MTAIVTWNNVDNSSTLYNGFFLRSYNQDLCWLEISRSLVWNLPGKNFIGGWGRVGWWSEITVKYYESSCAYLILGSLLSLYNSVVWYHLLTESVRFGHCYGERHSTIKSFNEGQLQNALHKAQWIQILRYSLLLCSIFELISKTIQSSSFVTKIVVFLLTMTFLFASAVGYEKRYFSDSLINQ